MSNSLIQFRLYDILKLEKNEENFNINSKLSEGLRKVNNKTKELIMMSGMNMNTSMSMIDSNEKNYDETNLEPWFYNVFKRGIQKKIIQEDAINKIKKKRWKNLEIVDIKKLLKCNDFRSLKKTPSYSSSKKKSSSIIPNSHDEKKKNEPFAHSSDYFFFTKINNVKNFKTYSIDIPKKTNKNNIKTPFIHYKSNSNKEKLIKIKSLNINDNLPSNSNIISPTNINEYNTTSNLTSYSYKKFEIPENFAIDLERIGDDDKVQVEAQYSKREIKNLQIAEFEKPINKIIPMSTQNSKKFERKSFLTTCSKIKTENQNMVKELKIKIDELSKNNLDKKLRIKTNKNQYSDTDLFKLKIKKRELRPVYNQSRGIFTYIDQTKADFIRVSDSLSKLNNENLLKNRINLANMYSGYADAADVFVARKVIHYPKLKLSDIQEKENQMKRQLNIIRNIHKKFVK